MMRGSRTRRIDDAAFAPRGMSSARARQRKDLAGAPAAFPNLSRLKISTEQFACKSRSTLRHHENAETRHCVRC
jgi:hypothetical protein